MTLPKYEDMYLPMLKYLSDNKERKNKEIYEALEKEFNLNDIDKNERMPSGELRFQYNIRWVKTYLKKAGLIANEKRGIAKITEKGLNTLKEKPSQINDHYLQKFDSFKDFRNKNSISSTKNLDTKLIERSLLPEDEIEIAYNQINEELASNLLEEILRNSPSFFEHLVLNLLLNMGYGNSLYSGNVIGNSHDEGIDGIISQDKLGLETIFLQAKRYKNTVGISEVRDFVGSLSAKKSNKGVFITTSTFSKSTEKYINSVNNTDKTIILINGKQLTELMIENDVGVNTTKIYKIKRLDMDYFEE